MSDQNPAPQTPQQSFGSAPSGSQSFGSAPTGSESMGSAPPAAAPAEQAPPKKKSPLPRIILSVAILAVLGGIGYFLSRDDAVKAEVGQCLAGTTAAELDPDKLKIVDCGASDAGFKVVERIEDKTYAESNAACTSEEAEFVFWSGTKETEPGTVLCLATVK